MLALTTLVIIWTTYISSFFLSLCADPLPVQVAIALSVGTNSASLYIQHPQLGLIDGVKVCVCIGLCDTVCEGLCGHTCTWYSLPASVHIITLSNLSPGSACQLKIYSTSQGQLGPPYYTHPIRTSELSLHILALTNVIRFTGPFESPWELFTLFTLLVA